MLKPYKVPVMLLKSTGTKTGKDIIAIGAVVGSPCITNHARPCGPCTTAQYFGDAK
jgi:hypothetical protein